ncbi:response regulator [Geobacter argillaceus]|uniref:LuxR family two component transcriptional regulator n=1 Tax=Geobacter argillaceus TaxID=345631 RepID=A0A562VK54_9BACT|nr:response regulator transcription factor [Geobacter argillaceus]TWJ18235.1 LuxR family two component transcriptional regulator [Geobacter argillaceus]
MQLIIVEDDHDLLSSLTLILRCEQGINVVGAYSTGEDALEFLDSHASNTMLVDLGLPGMSGIELIAKVKSKYPDIETMVYSGSADKGSILTALKAGATGYILKGSTPRELVESLHDLHAGGAPMSPKVARKVIREFHAPTLDDCSMLTRREREILACIEKGASYKNLNP